MRYAAWSGFGGRAYVVIITKGHPSYADSVQVYCETDASLAPSVVTRLQYALDAGL